MNESKTQKIKKLHKAHVWPAILFLILSIIMTMIASSFFAFAILSYFAADRMDVIHNNVQNIGALFPESSDIEEYKKVLSYLEKDTDYSEAIYLLDQNGNIIAGYGGATFDLSKDLNFISFTEKDYCFYLDKESVSHILNEAGTIEFDKIVSGISPGSLESLGSRRTKDVVLADDFWISVPVSSGQNLFVKNKLVFYTSDFTLLLATCAAAAIIALVPLLFLFINVLFGVSNQRHMTHVLYMDTVTGGKNWMYYEENARKALSARKNSGKMYALVDIALMKYRNFCTFHGVEEGEALLADTDTYLTSQLLRKKEFCAHNGRASFALLLRCSDEGSCRDRVQSMLKEMTERAGHVGTAYHAGIYFVEPSPDAAENKTKRNDINISELYNRASAARNSIPEDNPTETAVFDQELLEKTLWEHKVEEKMYQALENEEFIVYIQPKYNPVTEELAGAEALVRWISKEDGFISPGKFIPIFEKNGFITRLDDYMISHVAKLQSQWLAEGKNVVPISVNVSRAHFANANLAEHICSLVDAYGTPHHLIEIELTESAFFDDKAALLHTVRKLQEAGFDVSMDDFGAGYSSLNSLKDLPLNVLKLDADFFRGEDGESRGEIVVAEAISLAKKLNMRIVAEGIEKKEQVDFLARQNCDMIQGFYFAKPMPADEYQERL